MQEIHFTTKNLKLFAEMVNSALYTLTCVLLCEENRSTKGVKHDKPQSDLCGFVVLLGKLLVADELGVHLTKRQSW